MSGTPTIKGNNTIIWGTAGLFGSGTVLSVRKRRTSEKKKIKDNAGFTQTKVYYDQATEYEVQCLVETSVPTIEPGDQVTVQGITTCLADDVEVNWEQEGEAKWTLTVTSHDALTLT